MTAFDNDATLLARVTQAVGAGQTDDKPVAPPSRRIRRRAWNLPGILGSTHVATSFGDVPAHLVRVRDRIRTRDGAFLPVLRIDEYKLDPEFLDTHPEAAPILLRKGSQGPNKPVRDAMYSPGQKILTDRSGTSHELVDAAELMDRPAVLATHQAFLSYFVFHLGQAALVKSEGIWISLGE